MFVSFCGILLTCLLYNVGAFSTVPKPFVSTSLICYTYQMINGNTTKYYLDDCIFGNTCCYAAQFIDAKSRVVVESGGCEDEYRHVVGTQPMFTPMMPLTTTYLCEEGACIEQVTNLGTARLCACTENSCNMKGINDVMNKYHERLRRGQVKNPPDYANILEKTVQILVDG